MTKTMPNVEKRAAAATAKKAAAQGSESQRTSNGARPSAKAPAKPAKLKSEAKVQENLEDDVQRKAEELKARAAGTKEEQEEAEKKTEHILSAKLGDQLVARNTKTTKKETKGIFNPCDAEPRGHCPRGHVLPTASRSALTGSWALWVCVLAQVGR